MIKTLHLLGVCLFLGNIIVSALWKVMADRSGSVPVARFAVRLVNLTDGVFTGVGVTLIAITGHLMAPAWGGLDRTWIWTSYTLLATSGLLWLMVLVPIQLRQARLLRGLPETAQLPAAYHRLSLWWSVVGTIATLAPLPALWLMSAKPG
jgi:uncharacterized membrane protein